MAAQLSKKHRTAFTYLASASEWKGAIKKPGRRTFILIPFVPLSNEYLSPDLARILRLARFSALEKANHTNWLDTLRLPKRIIRCVICSGNLLTVGHVGVCFFAVVSFPLALLLYFCLIVTFQLVVSFQQFIPCLVFLLTCKCTYGVALACPAQYISLGSEARCEI